jgi:hypothetical protein
MEDWTAATGKVLGFAGEVCANPKVLAVLVAGKTVEDDEISCYF